MEHKSALFGYMVVPENIEYIYESYIQENFRPCNSIDILVGMRPIVTRCGESIALTRDERPINQLILTDVWRITTIALRAARRETKAPLKMIFESRIDGWDWQLCCAACVPKNWEKDLE